MSSSEVLSVQLVERLVCELFAEAVDGGHGNSVTAAENVLTRQERRTHTPHRQSVAPAAFRSL